ncbi:MAG: hypothetical protein JNJ45_06250 [Chthonomonas sp.]|nr:hypothetical protein [Chthonomonas sp.]
MSSANSPRRILIYGCTGSGKTTLARRLSEVTGVAWTEADSLTWDPGWVEVPLDEQTRRIQAVCDREEWILDTAYGKWLDVPLPRATLIVALDYPRFVSLGRLLRRTVRRVRSKEAVCNGNRETWSKVLSHDSIIAWHFKSFAAKRRRIEKFIADGRPVVRIRSPHDLESFLGGLRNF